MTYYREEEDSIGVVKVPSNKRWGAQTERARHNFKIGNPLMPLELIKSFAILKRSAALVNAKLENIPHKISSAIVQACDETIEGKHDNEFPLVVWQTGSGTQTNMNVNEVIAYRANEILGFDQSSKKPVHPNDHVNFGQSSNDSFPTAMHIATVMLTHEKLIPALQEISLTLKNKSEQFHRYIKVGRTHLQDATPLTLGQEFSAYVTQIELGIKRIQNCLPRLLNLAQGGTAVGTGINSSKDFSTSFANEVALYTKQPFKTALNKFEAIATHDSMVEFSGVLNVLACSFMKIASDIQWLASGPRCGLGELKLPENEPGSSIMPGKVNPTQAEAMRMVCCQVMGNHTAVSIAGSQGNFQLNVFKPVIIYNVLNSLNLLSDSIISFTRKCLKGIEVYEHKLQENLNKSLMLITALNPIIGYDKASKVAKKAFEENISLKESTLQLGYLSAEEFDLHINPKKMI